MSTRRTAAVLAVVSAPALVAATMPAHADQADRRSPLQATTRPLADASDGPGEGLRTRRLDTAAYEMVAVTWQGPAAQPVHVRTRTDGSWTGWERLAPLGGHAPDRRTGEARRGGGRAATELLWVGRSDGVQVRLPEGRAARVVLVEPGTLPSDTGPATGPDVAARTPVDDPTTAPQPRIRARSAWGADESWRSGAPVYNDRLKQAHVHHTAAHNDYRRSDVPAIIRGAYWYHTQVLGWSDLGYNFVVDRFGRIWEGRAGGTDRPVRGAHTLGFNHASFGVAAIGEYSGARPPADLVRALVRLSAWKLDRHGREPAGHTRVTSTGSDRYAAGTRVRLPVIDGHRDTNETECPGDRLYGKLPDIRRRAQERADGYHPPPSGLG